VGHNSTGESVGTLRKTRRKLRAIERRLQAIDRERQELEEQKKTFLEERRNLLATPERHVSICSIPKSVLAWFRGRPKPR
jgi:hypothetical protein